MKPAEMQPAVSIVWLGCDKNRVDSEVMLGVLKERGYSIAAKPSEADVIVINTCGFIEDARRESLDSILEMARYKAHGRCRGLLVTGCLVQRYKEELRRELPEIDGWVGTGNYHRVGEAVDAILAGGKPFMVGKPGRTFPEGISRIRSTPSHYAYIKIAEGCNHGCSYCVIPHTRGSYFSRPADLVVAEAARLAEEGVREIILVAQDTTSYGMDIYGRPMLSGLLRRLASIDGIHWIRVLYAHPESMDDETLEAIATEPRVCKYIDIPFQHVSSRVLRAMNRAGSPEAIASLVERLRAAVPGIAIRSTFIVGFPGETEEDVEELIGALELLQLDRVGVFEYSREDGTPAAKMRPRVPRRVARLRREKVMEAQRQISLKKNSRLEGSRLEVIVDALSAEQEFAVARSQFHAPEVDGLVYLQAEGVGPGSILEVVVTRGMEYDLMALPVRQPIQRL